MKRLVDIIGAILLLAIAVFSVFGFLATFEPTDNTPEFYAFRVGYCFVGFCCLVGAFVLIFRTRGRRDDRSPR